MMARIYLTGDVSENHVHLVKMALAGTVGLIRPQRTKHRGNDAWLFEGTNDQIRTSEACAIAIEAAYFVEYTGWKITS